MTDTMPAAVETTCRAILGQGTAAFRRASDAGDAFNLVSMAALVRAYVEANGGGTVWERANDRATGFLVQAVAADAWDGSPQSCTVLALDAVDAWADALPDLTSPVYVAAVHGAAVVLAVLDVMGRMTAGDAATV